MSRDSQYLTTKKTSGNRSARLKKEPSLSCVRIIGGRYKRQLVPFIDADGLRPTPDRLRETLFNWIQFELFDANVLDICAGSGVLGLEALSRGAAHATFIELQPSQAALISQTAEKFKLNKHQATVYNANAMNIIPTLTGRLSTILTAKKIDPNDNVCSNQNIEQKNPEPLHYHIVFVDPPYDLNLWVPMIEELISEQIVNENTFFYIEDKRPITQTLQQLSYSYSVIKQCKIGQVFATLLKIDLSKKAQS